MSSRNWKYIVQEQNVPSSWAICTKEKMSKNDSSVLIVEQLLVALAGNLGIIRCLVVGTRPCSRRLSSGTKMSCNTKASESAGPSKGCDRGYGVYVQPISDGKMDKLCSIVQNTRETQSTKCVWDIPVTLPLWQLGVTMWPSALIERKELRWTNNFQ